MYHRSDIYWIYWERLKLALACTEGKLIYGLNQTEIATYNPLWHKEEVS